MPPQLICHECLKPAWIDENLMKLHFALWCKLFFHKHWPQFFKRGTTKVANFLSIIGFVQFMLAIFHGLAVIPPSFFDKNDGHFIAGIRLLCCLIIATKHLILYFAIFCTSRIMFWHVCKPLFFYCFFLSKNAVQWQWIFRPKIDYRLGWWKNIQLCTFNYDAVGSKFTFLLLFKVSATKVELFWFKGLDFLFKTTATFIKNHKLSQTRRERGKNQWSGKNDWNSLKKEFFSFHTPVLSNRASGFSHPLNIHNYFMHFFLIVRFSSNCAIQNQ